MAAMALDIFLITIIAQVLSHLLLHLSCSEFFYWEGFVDGVVLGKDCMMTVGDDVGGCEGFVC